MIKILLVDDMRMMREILAEYLEFLDDFEVIGQCSNGQDAIKKALTLKPDIILMDIRMPGINGIETTRLILKETPDTKVIFLSAYVNAETVLTGIEVGAKGFVSKTAAIDDLAIAIRAVYKGHQFMTLKNTAKK